MLKRVSLFIDASIRNRPDLAGKIGFEHAQRFLNDLVIFSGTDETIHELLADQLRYRGSALEFFTPGTFRHEKLTEYAKTAHRMAAEIRFFGEEGVGYFSTFVKWYEAGGKNATLVAIVNFDIGGALMGDISWK